MARIFVSHASVDDADVTRVSEWLTQAGFKDHFVDHLHIHAGKPWDKELPREIRKSQIVILYVTRSWLGSTECFAEYRSVFYSGRVIVPLLISSKLEDLSGEEKTRFSALCASVQGIRITDFPPDKINDDLLSASLQLATKTFRRKRRATIIKRASMAAALSIVMLAGLSYYFRDFLQVYLEQARIARAFQAKTPEELGDLSTDVAARPIEERRFLECDGHTVCPEMTILPPGSFTMGGTGAFPNDRETPTVDITIPKSFAVSAFEITQAQWETCFLSSRLAENAACKELPTSERLANYPVDSVSWSDAQAYVRWLNTQIHGTAEGPYRLLSEAEWEYAARGVTRIDDLHTLYSWGDVLEDVCAFGNALDLDMPDNFRIASSGVDCPMPEEHPPEDKGLQTRVGTFKANAFGLYDTAGNLGEWVADCWRENHGGRPISAQARTDGEGERCERVIKGGSWYGSTDNLRPAARVKLEQELFGFNIGFRIARDLDWSAEVE